MGRPSYAEDGAVPRNLRLKSMGLATALPSRVLISDFGLWHV